MTASWVEEGVSTRTRFGHPSPVVHRCDYVDFSNGMHLWTKRVTPDPAWFNAITDAAMAAEEAIRDIITRYDAAVANLPATERIIELEEMRIA